jgi:DNA-binding MarR family transcriptional regulator
MSASAAGRARVYVSPGAARVIPPQPLQAPTISAMNPDPSSAPTDARAHALELLFRVGLLGNLVSEHVADATGDPELTRNLPIAVIADLAVHGRRRPAEIQHHAGMTSGGVTKLLDRLEQRGLVTRSFGMVPGDRRAIVVELTERGAEVADAVADGLLGRIGEVGEALREASALADGLDGERRR